MSVLSICKSAPYTGICLFSVAVHYSTISSPKILCPSRFWFNLQSSIKCPSLNVVHYSHKSHIYLEHIGNDGQHLVMGAFYHK